LKKRKPRCLLFKQDKKYGLFEETHGSCQLFEFRRCAILNEKEIQLYLKLNSVLFKKKDLISVLQKLQKPKKKKHLAEGQKICLIYTI